MKRALLILFVTACGGQAEYKCGRVTFDFEPACATAAIRIDAAFAFIGLFETDPRYFPGPPDHVSDRLCDPHSDCLGRDMRGLLHQMLHELDMKRLRPSTLVHFEWGNKGYDEALDSFDRLITNQEAKQPLKVAQ